MDDEQLVKTMLEECQAIARAELERLGGGHLDRDNSRNLYFSVDRLCRISHALRVASYRLCDRAGKRPQGAPPKKERPVQITLRV